MESEDDAVDEEFKMAIIIFSGTVLSTVGFVLMLLTAALFKSWRRSRVNLVWLHVCGTKLLCLYTFLWKDLESLGLMSVPWLGTNIGVAVTYHCANFLFHASCSWLAASAWLAYVQLVTATPDAIHPQFMMRAALFAYLTPFVKETCIIILDLLTQISEDIYNAIDDIYVVLIIVWCVIVYACALCSVYGSGRAAGRPPPDLLATAVLALMFALTSGIQFIIIIMTGYLQSNLVVYQIAGFILSYNVAIYAILLLFGIKQTRNLWNSLWNRKLRS